jgi:putative Holliday junction resolvase
VSRVLGIDPGRARIGLALSDETGCVALALKTLESTGGRRDLKRITELVHQHGVSLVVVGLPLRLDGTAGPAALEAEAFAERLRRRLSCPVVTHDERLTSVQATRGLRAAGHRGQQERSRVDAEAARLLLQSYLDARGSSDGSGGEPR